MSSASRRWTTRRFAAASVPSVPVRCRRRSGRSASPGDRRVREIGESPFPDADPFLAVDRCGECLRTYSAPLTYGVAYHPASVAFHWERGLDVATKGLWKFHDHLADSRWTAERVATDPAEYEVVLRRDGDALRCRLDANADVVRTERVRRR